MLNELVHTNRSYAAATARMASLEAQMASLKADLIVANGALDARRDKVRLLKWQALIYEQPEIAYTVRLPI